MQHTRAADPIESNTHLYIEWEIAADKYHLPLSEYRKRLTPFERRLNLLAYLLQRQKHRYAMLSTEDRDKHWP